MEKIARIASSGFVSSALRVSLAGDRALHLIQLWRFCAACNRVRYRHATAKTCHATRASKLRGWRGWYGLDMARGNI